MLPSLTVIADLSENVLLRGGVFRGLSRPDPNQYANGISVPSGAFNSLEDAVTGLSSTGNPALDPLTSWNVDAALEWYPNKDTILAAGVYYKKFKGSFEQALVPVDFDIQDLDGNVQSVTGSVITQQVGDESSNLYGVELTASHAFTYLPGFLGGFGTKFSWNYASSDFEFEDGFGGDASLVSVDANGAATTNELLGILPAAGLFGLSRNVGSLQLYWSGGRFDTPLTYKIRSNYFQQFTRDTTARVRFTDDNEVLDFRASYEVVDGVKLTFEALNLFDETRVDFRGVQGNVSQVLSFGPRLFFGVKAKL